MIFVSNTSPISNLAKVGQLSLMPQLYGRILIPCAVHEELLIEVTYQWLKERSPDYADKWFRNLINTMATLQQQP